MTRIGRTDGAHEVIMYVSRLGIGARTGDWGVVAAYGYRISLFTLAWKGHPKHKLDFDELTLPKPAIELFDDVLKDMINRGETDARKSTFFTVDSMRRSNWGLVTEASGGEFGSEARAVDVGTGLKTKDITAEEAVLRGSRLLMLIPPGEQYGMIISEVQGNASLLSPFINGVNLRLNSYGLKIHPENEIADGVAWTSYLGQSGVGINGVELITKQSVDRTNFDFDDSAGVSGVRLFVGVEPGSSISRRIFEGLKTMVGQQRHLDLVGLIGIRHYADEDFDEEKIITVKDGQKRTLDVSHGWPRFVYRISDTVRPDEDDFLTAVSTTAFTVFQEVGVQPTGAWFPDK